MMIMRMLGLVAVGCAASVACWGCGDGGGGGGAAAPGPSEFMSATVQGVAPAVALAVQASLAEVDSATFPELQGASPAVSATGTSTNGSVTLDFGASTVVNNATWSGTVVSTYVVTGANTVDLAVDLSGLTCTTSRLGTLSVAAGQGTVVLTGVTWTPGTARATANPSGADVVAIRWGGQTFDLDLGGGGHSWTFAVSGAERQVVVGQFNFARPVGPGSDDGYCELDASDPLEINLVAGQRSAVGGLAISVRTPGVQENYAFDSSNGGLVLVVGVGQTALTGTTVLFSL